MARMQLASACRQVGRLFGQGTVAGLGEGQLLDRFVARRDDAAFEAIVARHGPMVLAVCRSLLRDPNDVDDAFQAVFLVLVKRAESVRHRDLLGPWLHGVARRVALRSRAESARRRDRLPVGPEPAGAVVADLERLDDSASIHAEVERLPSSYRAAIVLCYLEGRTHEEAARELGWPVGTVRGRLARARDLLRGRLERRGVGLTSSALLAALARESEAAVPGVLLESTTKAAAVAATGPLATVLATSAIVSARAVVLAQGVLPAMTAAKLKLAATLVVVGLLVGPGASAQQGGGIVEPRTRANRAANSRAIAGDTAKVATPNSPSNKAVEARLKIAQEMIREFQGRIDKGDGMWDMHLQEWRNKAAEARRDLEDSVDQDIEIARRAAADRVARAKEDFEAGKGSKLDYLRAQYDQAVAETNGTAAEAMHRWQMVGWKPENVPIAKVDPQVGPAGSSTAPAPASPSGGAAERLKIAEEAIASLKQDLNKPSTKSRPGYLGEIQNQLRGWEGVADQARHDLGGPGPSYLGALRAVEAARGTEAAARKQFESGQGSKLEYLSAQLARVQAQQQADLYAEGERNRATAKAPAAPPAAPDESKAKPGTNPGPGPRVKADDGEIGAIGEPEPPRPRKLPKPHPSDADRDKVIEQALEKTVTLNFPRGTTLDEVLTFVRTQTKDAKANLPKGVPIYVDPIVTFDHAMDPKEKAFATIAPITLDDIPLRVALRLVLDQFSLSYQVRDRMVYILDDDLLDYRSEGAAEFHAASGMRVPARGGGMGGGMGGMGGMGGGAAGNQSPQGGGFR